MIVLGWVRNTDFALKFGALERNTTLAVLDLRTIFLEKAVGEMICALGAYGL